MLAAIDAGESDGFRRQPAQAGRARDYLTAAETVRRW